MKSKYYQKYFVHVHMFKRNDIILTLYDVTKNQ